jgi:hypothetical protein
LAKTVDINDARFSALVKRWPIGDVVACEPLHHKGTVFQLTTDRGARVILKTIGDPGQAERVMQQGGDGLSVGVGQDAKAADVLTGEAHDQRSHRCRLPAPCASGSGMERPGENSVHQGAGHAKLAGNLAAAALVAGVG